MTIPAASQGYQAQLGIDTASPVTKGYDFADTASMISQGEILDPNTSRGTRSHFASRTRSGLIHVGGQIALYPSMLDLKPLLPLILGGAASGGTYPLAETLPSFSVTIDKVAKVCTYAGCVVNRATFSVTEGQMLKLVLDIVGVSETISDAGTFPTVTYNETDPLIFSDAVLTILSTARLVKTWDITIDNSLDVRFFNSQTATSITPKDRVITFHCENPFTSAETDLFDQSPAGAAASLVLTDASNTADVLSFLFATLQFPTRSPQVPARSEITQQLTAVARATTAGHELSVTISP